MPGTTSVPFGQSVASLMLAAHEALAARWLDRLRQLLSVPVDAVFPSESLLDHIPGLICHIAEALGDPTEHALVANTEVITKARELGELRFSQHASVHQLMREYRLLGDVLNGFVAEVVVRPDVQVDGRETLEVSARVQESVFVLMQTTVDAFVERYSDTVSRQTARLEGFNRMVSHELRQPLGTIRSAVDMLGRDGALTDQARTRFVEIIETNTRRMATLTNTLLTLSSLEADSLQTQEADLGRLVDDACGQLAEMAERRQVAIRPRVPSMRIRTDVARVELILVNLISNAIKYSDPAKPERFVDIAAAPEPGAIRVSVSDNGLGIPAADRRRVFEGFFRAHASRDQELGADGIGLGLAIVAECVRHLNARLDVDSEDGAGTTFHVRLPCPDDGL